MAVKSLKWHQVRDLGPLLPQAYKGRVFRPQGWISVVVLVDGCMRGVWEHKIRRSQAIEKELKRDPHLSRMQMTKDSKSFWHLHLVIPIHQSNKQNQSCCQDCCYCLQ
jgi:hypothetical protein